jgi:hypothetical protein
VSAWLCAAAAPGSALTPELRAALAARVAAPRGPAARLHGDGFAAAARTAPDALRPLLASRGPLLAVGDVRLDNRAEVASWGGAPAGAASDLDLVLAAYAARGAGCLDGLLGDFAFAVRDAVRGTLMALRDPFGVRGLFLVQQGGTLVLSSRLEALACEGELDEEWVADFLVGGAVHPGRTVWAGVRALPPGEALAWSGGRLRTRCFWRAAELAPAEPADGREAAERFRELLEEAVRVRLEDGAPAWAELGGGPASAAVARAAQSLAAGGRAPALAGAVAAPGAAAEMARRCGLRPEPPAAGWAWRDDGAPATAGDEPRRRSPFWARERELVARVRAAGGRVLLSGRGPELLPRPGGLVATSAAAPRPTALARRDTLPFHPGWLVGGEAAGARLPGWLDAEFVQRLGLAARLAGAAPGREGLPGWLETAPLGEGIEVRYPLLYRPLVEYTLRLPASLRDAADGAGRLLREAAPGARPEEARAARRADAAALPLARGLRRERTRLDDLLEEPEIAWRGWVRGDALRDAAREARRGEGRDPGLLLRSLALETWLAVRSGHWDALARGPRALPAG